MRKARVCPRCLARLEVRTVCSVSLFVVFSLSFFFFFSSWPASTLVHGWLAGPGVALGMLLELPSMGRGPFLGLRNGAFSEEQFRSSSTPRGKMARTSMDMFGAG